MKSNLTSIIIAVHNQLEYTKMCLDSLSKCTPRDLYELIIVDNNSSDETLSLLAEYEAKTIRNDENIGVTPAWNLGIKEAKGEFIVFIHNDVLLTPGWLENLLEPFSDPEIWCISPRLSRHSLPRDFSHLVTAINCQSGKHFEAYLERSCFALRRDAVERLGAFDENLKMYYYDFDYQYRLIKAGHPPVQAANVAIHHFESRTAIAIPSFFVEHKPSEWEYLHNKWSLSSSGSPVEGPEFQQHLTKLESVRLPAQKPIYEAIAEVDKIAKKSESPRIIACINVFDEIEFLPGCIESLVSVDEIHIVDGAYQDFPHKQPHSTDGTLEWIEERAKSDERIKLTRCSRAWKDEVEKRNAFFTGKERDWYLFIDADESLESAGEEDEPIEILKSYLDGCRLDCFALRIREAFGQAVTYQFARIFRHLPGIRVEACHYNVVADGERYLWLEVEEGGNLLLYSGFYLLHQKRFRGTERIEQAKIYYYKKDIEEVRNLGSLIKKHFSDIAKKKTVRCWTKMYQHLISQVPPEDRDKVAIDRKYLESGNGE